MTGACSLWLGMTGTLPAAFETTIGPGMMIVGALLVFLFSSTRKVTSASGFLLRGLDGFKAVYNITAAFGDVLSYMRLFALGLSGASLGHRPLTRWRTTSCNQPGYRCAVCWSYSAAGSHSELCSLYYERCGTRHASERH